MENRYTRLKAIKAFGYDIEWELMHLKTVTLPGVGGLGVIIAEMLTRCGIGTIHIFDKDIVEEVNLNRVGFYAQDLGKSKVVVLKKFLGQVNADVHVVAHHGDIMNFGMDEEFDRAVQESDLVIMGLDNYPARMFTNQKCINHNTPLIDGGVSRSGLSGYVHVIIPSDTACMMCRARVRGSNEQVERGLPCTASLPTTLALIASIQTQEAIKFFFNLGTQLDYQTYNALTSEFNNYTTQKDESCPACSPKSKKI